MIVRVIITYFVCFPCTFVFALFIKNLFLQVNILVWILLNSCKLCHFGYVLGNGMPELFWQSVDKDENIDSTANVEIALWL